MNASNETSVPAQAKAWNLHTWGCGFINRLRFIPTKGKGKDKGYWAVAIGALYGVEDENGKANFSPFDLNVYGTQAIESVIAIQQAFDEGKKIFVEFKAGDTRPSEPFKLKKGPREGELVSSIKGSLLLLQKVWINGELVIDASKQSLKEPEGAPSKAESDSTNDGDSVEGSGPAESEAQTPTWQERLKDFPERLVIEKSDPEFLDKVLAIGNLGRYEAVQAKREDCVAFKLIQLAEEAA